ncbi:hypothetical protein BO71DRAFT_163837 [Aspergillus ellipticus CBS 707.79]|uniref:Transcription factor domain-containing protein n=1 Tax=Aspergillus ellipticus CBS 707.79 TaxID=1448320 RepID=A0A319DH92_9EURO|nr:hypothetical protein BO71DRAFT_163837 [Aspergillus ellipticus CBS 707.79]
MPCPASVAEDNARQRSGSDRELEDSRAFSPSDTSNDTHLESPSPEHMDAIQPVNDRTSDLDQPSISFPVTSYSFPEQENTLSHTHSTQITPEYTQLLHYFKAAIGWPWFDITDPGFTMQALRLAPMSPLPLYAILATACIHKSRNESAHDVAYRLAMQAESLHEKCISILLPMIQQKDLITDGAFLACNTILRFYEEISAPVHGRDDARHLLGGIASVTEFQNQELEFDDLSRAAFWVHLRQDTVVAIINHRVPHMNLDIPDIVPFDATDGYT